MLISAGALACWSGTVCAEPDALKYKIDTVGASDKAVEKAITTTTMTYKLLKRPPATLGQLRHRMQKDLPRIEAVLTSFGYYSGTVSIQIDPQKKPVRAAFNIVQGAPFHFGQVDVHYSGAPVKISSALQPGQRVQAAQVFAEQQRILQQLQNSGYPFPALKKRAVEIDQAAHTVDLTLIFEPGPLAEFGEWEVVGLDSLPPSYITRQITWKTGEPFTAAKISSCEKKLTDTGLFGSVRIEPLPAPADHTAVPIRITVTERDQRTIRLGVSYSDIGPGVNAYWEHRNAFGGGERLETTLAWTPIDTGAEAKLTRPGFLDARQSLVLELDSSRETPDAYTANQTRTTGMVLRDVTPGIQGGAGLGYQFSQVDQLDSSERYAYVLFPLQFVFDHRDDALNPTRGERIFSRTTWYEDTRGADSFLKTIIEARHYSMLWKAPRLSSALRLKLGHIDGTATDSVPADERFYAGGGGSIRGYDHQAVGPSEDATPTGGNGLLEFSAELRLQPGSRLGYVAFIDGGTAFDDSLDEPDLRYGAGVGLRWFTTIGPLRADLAYPLNPDDTQAERLLFYISLGQAF